MEFYRCVLLWGRPRCGWWSRQIRRRGRVRKVKPRMKSVRNWWSVAGIRTPADRNAGRTDAQFCPRMPKRNPFQKAKTAFNLNFEINQLLRIFFFKCRTYVDGIDVWFVSEESLLALEGAQVPKFGRAIHRPGHHNVLVGQQRHGTHVTGVSHRRVDFLAGLCDR